MSLVFSTDVICKNLRCPFRGPIPLPYPHPPEITEGQPAWPKDTWRAYLACPQCGFVYEYSAKDVRWGAADANIQNRLLARPGFYRLDIECAGIDCGTLILIHVYLEPGKTIDDAIQNILRGNFLEATRCENGHLPRRDDFPILRHVISGPIQSL